MEKGNSPDENQVSKTSTSCSNKTCHVTQWESHTYTLSNGRQAQASLWRALSRKPVDMHYNRSPRTGQTLAETLLQIHMLVAKILLGRHACSILLISSLGCFSLMSFLASPSLPATTQWLVLSLGLPAFAAVSPCKARQRAL